MRSAHTTTIDAVSGEAAYVTSAEAGVAAATVSTTALRPKRYRKGESERRDAQQATHMSSL